MYTCLYFYNDVLFHFYVLEIDDFLVKLLYVCLLYHAVGEWNQMLPFPRFQRTLAREGMSFVEIMRVLCECILAATSC